VSLRKLANTGLLSNPVYFFTKEAFMPNWCNNILKVEGESKWLDTFLSDCFSKDEYGRVFFDFEKIIPLGEPGKFYEDTCRIQWGTKWNSIDCDIKIEKSAVTVWFETAWTPPEPVIKALSKKYPSLSLRLEYNEPGVGFRGLLECHQGKVTLDHTWNMTSKDMIELGFLDEETA
jgi:hypothetical protein